MYWLYKWNRTFEKMQLYHRLRNISASPINGNYKTSYKRGIGTGVCLRCNGYNRSYLQSRLSYRKRPTTHSHRKTHTPFFSFISLISPIIRHIMTHCRATKQVTNFTTLLPLIQSYYIVHCGSLCLQIEWHRSRGRETFGGLGYPEGSITGIRQACSNTITGR